MYHVFGILLLNDETGDLVERLEYQHSGKSSEIVMGILQDWLMGKGLAPTWQSLIQTLRDSHLNLLAAEIAANIVVV